MTVESYVVAGTGHRPEKLGGHFLHNPIRDRLVAKLERRLLEIRAEHPGLVCLSGMALGFDQWLVQSCVRLAISFEAALPFVGQDLRWPAESRAVYRMLLDKAAKTHVVSPGGYGSVKMQLRNIFMVDHCQHLIEAWDGSPGGTANCVRYAAKVGRSRENLLPL